jgi:hypothetical protein
MGGWWRGLSGREARFKNETCHRSSRTRERESGLGLARGLARGGRDTGEVISLMLTGWEEYEREGVRYGI